MPHDFVVLSTMRCGSYHLTSLLDSAPDLTCLGEIYKAGKVELPRPLLRKLGLNLHRVEERNAMGPAFLHKLAAEAPGQGLGFKLFPVHVSTGPAFLRDELFSGRRRIVALTRPALEVAISLAASRATGAFTLTSLNRRGNGQAPVEVTAKRLEAAQLYLKRLRAMRDRLAATDRVEVFDITYAELADTERLDALLQFLGSRAQAAQLSSSYKKQSNAALHERVTNWPQIVAHLTQTDRGHLLAEAGYDP